MPRVTLIFRKQTAPSLSLLEPPLGSMSLHGRIGTIRLDFPLLRGLSFMSRRSPLHPENLRLLWPWLPLWSVVMLAALFMHGPMPLYSTRTLAVAWEMWSHHQWIVPHLNGQPYSHKVPLLYWLIHAGWALFGVNDIWPRLLEFIFGAAELVLAMVLARRLFPERPWVVKATPWMLMAFGYGFLFSTQIMYDVLLAVCVLAALLCLMSAPHRQRPSWFWFAFWIGAGLLTKGPVMLLHIVFPWLLGPLWSQYARENRTRWYGFGVLAMLGGLAVLVAWVVPATQLGGQAYADRLLFKQTGGRVVDAFAHARPLWWYLPWIPAFVFPFSLWPRAWAAVIALRRPLVSGVRFALCWLLPMLLAFSLISGKQAYYPLPEYAGLALLMAGAISMLRERYPAMARSAWLGPWPLALASFAFGALLLALPNMLGRAPFDNHQIVDVAASSRFFGVIYLLLGALLLVRGRGELRRIAIAGLVGVIAMFGLFSLSLWHDFNLHPADAVLHTAARHHRLIGNEGNYDGQFTFAARLRRPVHELHGKRAVQRFATAHPDALIVTYPHHPTVTDLRYAVLVQPYRGLWMAIYRARTLSVLRHGGTPPDPAQPTLLYPRPDYWRYGQVQ